MPPIPLKGRISKPHVPAKPKPHIPLRKHVQEKKDDPRGIFDVTPPLTPVAPVKVVPADKPKAPERKAPKGRDVPLGQSESVFDAPSPFPTPLFDKNPRQTTADRISAEATRRLAAYNDSVFAARQKADVEGAIDRRVRASAGLAPPGAGPFFGVTDPDGKPGGLPAQHPEWVTNATAKATLARANAWRIGHGGLAPLAPAAPLRPVQPGQAHPPAVSPEDAAMHTLATSRALTFRDKHRLPTMQTPLAADPGVDLAAVPVPHLTIREIVDLIKGDKPHVQRIRGTSDPQADLPIGRRNAGGAIPGYGKAEGVDWSGILDSGADAAKAIGTSGPVKDALRTVYNTTPLGQASQVGEAAAKLGTAVSKLGVGKPGIPHIAVAWEDIDPAVQADLTENGKKQAPTVYLDDLERYGDFVLGPAARKPLVEMAVKNGWNEKDAHTWNDAELAARAFQKNDKSLLGFVRNFANDVGQAGALASAPAMEATAIRQAVQERRIAPALSPAQQIAQGFVNVLPLVGDRPWTENIYERPFTTVTAVLPIAKFAGRSIGRFGTRRGNPLIKPTRDITMPTTGHTVNVQRSQEPISRLIEVGKDAILQRGAGPVRRQAQREVGHSPGVTDAVRSTVQRAGHFLENRETKKVMRRFHEQAQLAAGQDPSVLLNMMIASIRDLPTSWKDAHPLHTGLGKQTFAEAIAHHHSSATESKVLADYWSGLAEDSAASASRLRETLPTLEKAVDDMREAGNEARATEIQRQINETQDQIVQHEQEQFMQENLAEFSRNNNIDVLKPGSEKEGAAAYAMTMVSLAKTKMLMEQGKMDEAGQLWGDWSKRLQVVHRMEAPGSERAIELGQPEGTDAWHLADVLLNPHTGLRELNKEMRGQVEGSALADASSPAAQQALGRAKASRAVLQSIERRQAAADNALRRSQEGAMGRSQEAVADPVEPTVVSRHRTPEKAKEVARARAAANPDMRVTVRRGKSAKGAITYEVREKPKFKATPEAYDPQVIAERTADAAGVGAGVVRAIRQAADRLHAAKNERATRAVAKQEKYVAGLEATERAAHGTVSSAAVRAAEAELNRMLLSRGSARENATLEVGKWLSEHNLTNPAQVRAAVNSLLEKAPEGSADRLMLEDLMDNGAISDDVVYGLQQAARGRYNPKGMAVRPARIEAQRAKVQALRDAEATDFQPSPRLAKAQLELDNLRDFLEEGVALKLSEVEKIISDHATPAQRAALKDVRFADTLMGAMHQARAKEIGILRDKAQRIYDEAAARYEAIAGSATDMKLRAEDTRNEYVVALRKFAENQINEGRRGFHTNLHMPGDSTSTSAPREALEDYQWRSGNFTLDQHLYLVRDLERHTREAVKAEVYKLASASPLVIENAIPGDKIPPGWLLVKAEAYHLLKKPNRTADENASLVEGWKPEAQRVRSGATVPDDGVAYSLVTEDMHSWVKETLSSPSHAALNTVLQLTNMYRRWMLFSVPRTFVNNAIGNPILAMMAGAGPLTYYRSLHIIRKHPELIPKTLRHVGPLANLLDAGSAAKMVGYQAFWRNANVMMEDNGRFMVYLMHAVRAYKNDNAIHWFKKVDMADKKMVQLLDDLAHGRDERVHDFADYGVQWFGDMARNFKHDNTLATLFLFHRWVAHMIHLTLWTMPTKYPGRTVFLQQTAALADQYRKEHGAFPEWATSMIPLWDQVDTVLGKAQTVSWALSSGGFLPQSTPGQTFDLGSQGQPKAPLQSLVAANITPPLRILAEQTIGRRLDTLEPFMDRYGEPIGALNGRVTLNSLIANTPVLNSYFLRQGLSDDSIQGISEFPRYEKRAEGDEQWRTPRALGHGFLYDNLLRLGGILGVTLRPIDNRGMRTEAKAYGSISYQSQEASRRNAKEGKRKYLHDLAEYQKDPAKWKREHKGLAP